jgi:hypothetical protein
MKRDRGAAPVGVPELLVRAALPNFGKPVLFQQLHDLARF